MVSLQFKQIFFALLIVSIASISLCAEPDTREIIAREGKGILERQNGQLVLRVKGTPYEMGFQHGKLLQSLVRKNIQGIADNQTNLGDELAYQIYKALRGGMHARLVKFIPQRFLDEMRGIADGANLTFRQVLAGNLFPEAFHCSGIALMNDATQDGSLYHVRILDFMTHAGLQDSAVVVIHEPDGGFAFMNIGFAGFMGSVTGMNEKQIAIGEMGGMGQFHWDGLPMSLLIRDALERAATLQDVMDIYRDTPRTCEYYYVISDAKTNEARAVYATPKQLHFVKPGENYALFDIPQAPPGDSGWDKSIVQNFEIETHEWQTTIEGSEGKMLAMINRQPPDSVVVSGSDRFLAFVNRLMNEGRFGAVNEQVLMQMIARPVSMKSNLHNAIFHPATLEAWVAVAGPDGESACDMPYYHYRLTKQDELEETAQTTLAK